MAKTYSFNKRLLSEAKMCLLITPVMVSTSRPRVVGVAAGGSIMKKDEKYHQMP
jgi:hypothetical protein